MLCLVMVQATVKVAPVRERGLKSHKAYCYCWSAYVAPVRERGLKFIADIDSGLSPVVAPVRERGLKSYKGSAQFQIGYVAPVRERGLKFIQCIGIFACDLSLP